MSDASEDKKRVKPNITLPEVLCTDHTDYTDTIQTNTIPSSESKLSLPSKLGTPTSPLKISSPLSLPTSPTPFIKTSLKTRSNRSLDEPTQSSDEKKLSGSATGNPRNKCALQPGHSLMDWIRLGNSGKDLTGVGGRLRPVSPVELAAHNTQKDAWLAIRGRVYNITHYLPYHPGGPEELMRGAGIDATELFNKVHAWVNYDSLLAKCLVGPLRYDVPDAEELFDTASIKSDRLQPSKAQELVRKSMENLANCITPVRKKVTAKSEENVKGSPPSKIMQSLIMSSDLPVSISRRAAFSPLKTDKTKDTPPQLRFDWIQTSAKVTLSIYTGALSNPGGCASLNDGVLLIEIVTNGWLRTVKLIPEERLKEPLQLRVYSESGKIEVIALKEESKVWKNCGSTSFSVPVHFQTPRSMKCRVMHTAPVSHDTTLLVLAPCAGPVLVPLGHHVRVHATIDDTECVRSYTPIGDHWESFGSELSALKLAVKRYEAGVMSTHLTALRPGDALTVSGPYGNMELQKLKHVKTALFIAAGTGITPMLGLLRFVLSRTNPKCERIHLLFFNKTEKDIIFREKFEELRLQDERLNVVHVLSNEPSWGGHKGRISTEILKEVVDTETNSENYIACLCGPTEFTHTGVDLLKKCGLNEDRIHAFIG